MRVVLAAASVGAVLVPRPARADFERLALRYESSNGCPAESEFVATVETYTKRWSRAWDDDSATLSIHVRLSSGPEDCLGKLAVTAPGETTTEREIVGPSCAEVSHALAVMVAVALDARSGTTFDPKDEVTFDPKEKEAVLPPAAGAGAPLSTEASAPPRESSPPHGPKLRGPKDALRVQLDLRAEMSSAVVRGSLPGVGASLTVSPESSPSSAPGVAPASSYLGKWRPSLGVGIRQSFPKERLLPRGKAELLWTTANLRLCPLQLAIGQRIELSPCAETNIGVLRASASGFPSARSVSTLWLDVGGAAWVSVALWKNVVLSSTFLVTMPLNRQPFTTDSGVRVTSVPPLGVLGGVGLGVRM